MKRLLPVLMISLALTACADTPVVEQTPQWTLRETLRIGGTEDGPTSFSAIKGIAEGTDGRLYVYEHSTQDIRVFTASGTFDRTIGRRGSGPGELSNAEGIAFASDGTLWVRDAANGRFSRFDADGNVLDGWTMTYCWSQGVWRPLVTPERLVDWDCVPSVDAERIVGYRTDRTGVDSLGMGAPCGTQDMHDAATWITEMGTSTRYVPIPWAPRPAHTYDATGATWCAPNSARYELLRLTLGGDTVRVLRDVPPVLVTSADRDSVIALIEMRGPTGLDFSRIPATKPAIHQLTVDDRNRLWVRRDRPEGGIVFDIIEPDGTVTATVTLDGVRTNTRSPFVVRGDVVLLVMVDEDDVPQLGRFVIERGE